MEGNGEQMCPVCTLYLRPGMTLQDHLFTHPKDQVIEALVRLAMGSSPVTTVNTNSHQQITAITYRQFQTLTTNVQAPEPTIPMMLNPCLVNSPITSGVIRSSVPLLSYPYYQPDQQQANQLPEQRVESNAQCSYMYATQTTQTTQTNSPYITNNNSPFHETTNCVENQEVNGNCQSFNSSINPFVNEQTENQDLTASNNLPSSKKHSDSMYIRKDISEVEKTDNIEETNGNDQNENLFESGDIDDIHEGAIDPFDEAGELEDQTVEHGDNSRCKLSNRELSRSDNLINNSSHNLGTVISNTHRLIANDPSLDYAQGIHTDDLDYPEQNYGNLSPNTRAAVSPGSDNSNWSSHSAIRVRRDLSNFDDSVNQCIFVQQDSSASEYVTSDPYDDGNVNHSGGHQLTNLDNMTYSTIELYSTDHDLVSGVIDEPKEDNSTQSAPLNIHSDELMPPRGELSGQESLGATENSVWEIQNGEPSDGNYQFLEKGRWQVLGSGVHDNASEVNILEKNHSVKCLECDMKFTCVKERRIHVQTQHKTPRHTEVKTETGLRTNKYSDKSLKAQIVKIKQEKLSVKTEPVARTCLECNLELQTLKEFRIHRKEFHEVKKKCTTCDTVFEDNLSYKEHLAKVHPIECNVCGKFFPSKTASNVHAKSHLKFKPFQCTVCDKSFVTRTKLSEHNNVHSGETPFKCTMCDQTFRRRSNLLQHKNFFHLKMRKKVKDYFCHCGEIFHSLKKLYWHKEIHDTKPKQCMYCSERYIHSTSLTRHIRHAHDNTYLPKVTKALNILCPICKIMCIKTSLAQHMKIHTADKSFTCNVCSKEFSTNWNLQMHKWTHASRNSKPYKCKQCKSAFYLMSNYQAHIRSHRNIRPYTCNYCGRQFIRKSNCIRHVKEHESNKSYCCSICNKTFHRSYYLTEHMRTHTGVKPYTCHICSKTSSTKSNHNKHVRTHHAREPVNTEG